VRLRRIRTGEWLALVGAVLLAVLLSFDWFFLSTPDARVGAHESGWRSMGWPISIVLLAAICAALAMVFTTATQRGQGWAIVLTVITTVLGMLGTLLVAVRLIAQPGLGVDAGNVDVEIEPAAWLGLLSIFAIGAGGFISQLDERTDAPESIEQTEDVLRVRGAPRPAPARENPAGRAGSGPPDAVADPPSA
jgi:drug/metabolite transporter (DMT)-like permease